jgi:hypothetical protein
MQAITFANAVIAVVLVRGAMVNLTVAAFQRAKRQGLRGLFISTVHDSIVADVEDVEQEAWIKLFDEVFRDLPSLVTQAYGVEWNIPMLGEVSVGPNMLDLTEVKL